MGAAALAAGKALFAVANKAADATDRIDKMSQKIGLSRTAFQEWDYILAQSGTDVEKLQVGMKTLRGRMDEAASGAGAGAIAFQKLQLEAVDPLTGSLKNQDQMLEETIRALQKLPEGAEKSSLAMELFGKAGLELMPLLNDTSASMDDLRQKAHDLGLVMSDEAVDAGVLFQDTMDDLKKSFGAVMTKVGVELMPIFQSLADWIISHMPEIQEITSKAFDIIKTAVGLVVDLFQLLWPAIKAIYDFISPYFPTIAAIVKKSFEVIATAVTTVIGAFETVASAIKTAYDWLTKWNMTDAKKKDVSTTQNNRASDGTHAAGLAYVPFDGYMAELHKGERVMTADENSGLAAQIVNGIAAVMGNTQKGSNPIQLVVNLNGKTIAEQIYPDIKNEGKRLGMAGA